MYRIKPIEWKQDYDFVSEKGWEAITILTSFMVDVEIDANANINYWWGYIDKYGSRETFPCKSIEDGKAQAEICYRNKLMEALEEV